MKGRIIGVLVMLAVIAIGVAAYMEKRSQPEAITLKGFVGGEKTGFLDDEEVKKILLSRYGIVVDYSKAGSIEMATDETGDRDFLWPSSQAALELYKSRAQSPPPSSEIIFNSPIVLYSWDIVADALEKQDLATREGSFYMVTGFPKLIHLIMEKTKWADIGLGELYGALAIVPTDPAKSNSGFMFACLVANTLHGDLVDETSIDEVLPQLKAFFSRLGYLEHSSGDLFEQYLRTGVGAKPIIAGYENQIVEFSLEHKDVWNAVKDKIRILYPVPTVWSAHPLIALNERGVRLVKALQDKEIQELAWRKHGFRTGLMGVQNDPSVLSITGIPGSIGKVVPLPGPRVVEKIIQALQQ
ncbi:MAG: hypothetical protein AB7W37_03120 [Syntrophobacteraceae bacterium]